MTAGCFNECFNVTNGTTYDTPDPGIPSVQIASIAIITGFSFLAIFANITVMRLVYKKRHRRSLFDLTVCSLVTADLLTSLTTIGSGIVIISDQNENASMKVKKGFKLTFVIFDKISIYCFTSSILHIILITAERLFGVFAPFIYRRVATKFKTKIIIASIWLFSLGLAIVKAFAYKGVISDEILAIIILVSGGLMSVFYGIIAVKVYGMRLQKIWTKNRESSVLTNALAVTLSFVVSTFPFAISSISNQDSAWVEKYAQLCASLVATKLLFDPLLYYIINHYGRQPKKTSRSSRKRSRVQQVAAFFNVHFQSFDINVASKEYSNGAVFLHTEERYINAESGVFDTQEHFKNWAQRMTSTRL